jgi:hypothetical protein
MPLEDLKPLTFKQACAKALHTARLPLTEESEAKVVEAVRRAKLLIKTDPMIVELLLNRTREAMQEGARRG